MRRVKKFLGRLVCPAAWCPPEAAAVLGTVCGICVWHVPRTAFFLLLTVFLPRTGRRILLVFAAAALLSVGVRRYVSDPVPVFPRFVQAEVEVTDLGVSRVRGMTPPSLTGAKIRRLCDASGRELPGTGRVLVRFPAELAALPVAGSMFLGEGVLEMPRGDFAGYVRRRGACGVLSLRVCRETGFRRSWRSMLAACRDGLLARTVRHIEPEARKRAVAALFFGVRGGLDRASRRELVNAGVIHLYSVSGLHVGICAAMLFVLLRGVPFFRLRYILLIALTLLYVLSTGANIPAVRAWVMIAVWASCRAFLRWMPARTVLGYTAAGMLIWEPGWLFDMGFLYSFGITLALILSAASWREARRRLFCPLTMMPRSALRRRTARRMRAGHLLLQSAGACTAAFLGGAVVGLGFQRRLLPGAVAANILLLPVTAVLFPLLALKTATGWLWTGWDRLLAHLVEIVWCVMDAVIGLAQHWGATVTGRPAVWTAAIFLFGLLLALWQEAGRRIRIAGALSAAAVLIAWHVAMFRCPPAVLIVHGGHAEFPAVAVADTAAGTGCVVNVPDAASAAKIADFLLDHGIAEVDRVMFSMPRSGTEKGLRTLLDRMRVRQVVRNPADRHDRAFRLRLEEVRREVPGLGETELSGGLAASGAGGELQQVTYRNPATGFDVRVEFLSRPDRLRVNGRELAFPPVSESEAVVFSPETGAFARQNAEDRLTFPGKAVY